MSKKREGAHSPSLKSFPLPLYQRGRGQGIGLNKITQVTEIRVEVATESEQFLDALQLFYDSP
jgi:hypothetical protein